MQPRRVCTFNDVIKSYFGPVLKLPLEPTALSFVADGTKLIISLSQSGSVAVVELNSATHPRIVGFRPSSPRPAPVLQIVTNARIALEFRSVLRRGSAGGVTYI